MSIFIEANSVLALRENNIIGFSGNETVPKSPTKGITYAFVKRGQRAFPIGYTIPLLVTEGNCRFTRLAGFVKILSYAVSAGETYEYQTAGFYEFVRAASKTESDFYLNLGKESAHV